MRLAAYRGAALHAPENSRFAMISAWCGGADILHLDVRMSQDGTLIAFADATTDRTTGKPGTVAEMKLADLQALDTAATYRPRNSSSFQYYPGGKYRIRIEALSEMLETLPEEATLLLELFAAQGQQDAFAAALAADVELRKLTPRLLLASRDGELLKRIRRRLPDVRILAAAAPADLAATAATLNADGVLANVVDVFDTARGGLTALGQKLADLHRERGWRFGAALLGTPADGDWAALSSHSFIASIAPTSLLDSSRFTRPGIPLVQESFAGSVLDRERFSFGYAKANRYALVKLDNGVTITIAPYDQPLPAPTGNTLEDRLLAIENKLTFAARDWPYYSGGGLGVRVGLRGSFAAEVDYTVKNVGQAVTLEMAVVNADPASHRGASPKTFRDKATFYDPHGAPPFVGVEHDEDDGYRINWNLGTEADTNQYGKPVGDGATPRAARLRLERRGPFFAAYYRNDVDARDWVCVGAARNDSLNAVVYLRCVGKRWRQEKADDPTQYMPILDNVLTFRNLSITRHPD